MFVLLVKAKNNENIFGLFEFQKWDFPEFSAMINIFRLELDWKQFFPVIYSSQI